MLKPNALPIFATLIAAFSIGVAQRDLRAGENDLFSRVRVSSAFPGDSLNADDARSDQEKATGIRAETGRKIGHIDQLNDVLQRADLVATRVDDRTLAVKKTVANRTHNVVFRLDADGKSLRASLLLLKSQPSNDRLLQLLAANRRHAPVFFAYDAKRQVLELTRFIDDSRITAAGLRAEVEKLAEIATTNLSLWSSPTPATSGQASPAASAASGGPKNAPSRPATSSTTTGTSISQLVGRWTAARNRGEAFALQLTRDGKFALAHVRNGQTSRSTGTYVVKADVLQLQGKGLQLAGKVVLTSRKQFQFQPRGSSSSLTFRRAN